MRLYATIIARYANEDIDGMVLPNAILEADQIIEQGCCDSDEGSFYRNVILLANGVRFKDKPLDNLGENLDCVSNTDRTKYIADLQSVF
jgi:acetone carboxylase gamma subunit